MSGSDESAPTRSSTPARLIIEADGGSRGNPGPAAFGALVRDADSGQVIFEVGETLGVTTNNVAEYRGLLAGLEAAHEIAPDAPVEARLDSKLVVEQMSGRWKIKNADLQALAEQAGRIFAADQVTYTWVPRAENAGADALLNEALEGRATRRFLDAPFAGSTSADSTSSGRVSSGRARYRLPAWGADETGPPARIYLVRHGQTAHTVAHLFSGGGVAGPDLNDAGREEARRAGTFLAGEGEMAAVIASPTSRTVQTAEAIADVLRLTVTTDEQWREADFGAWEGMTLAEVTERFPTETSAWFNDVAYAPPGGESLEAMGRRIVAARDDAVSGHPGRSVVVVTHSMPIRALARDALAGGPETFFRLQPGTGSVSLLDVFPDGMPVLTSLNIRP